MNMYIWTHIYISTPPFPLGHCPHLICMTPTMPLLCSITSPTGPSTLHIKSPTTIAFQPFNSSSTDLQQLHPGPHLMWVMFAAEI